MELNNVKVVRKQPTEHGKTKAGKDWKKQLVIVETDDQYPKQVAITVWNEAANKMETIAEGTSIDVKIRVESREYNHRWYTDVVGYEIVSKQQPKDEPKPTVKKKPEPVKQEDDNDLPF